MGILYLVATPIGNLEDISPRATRIMQEVHLIAAEDTRVTRKLLSHLHLHTPLTSYFEHNKLTKLDTILAALSTGDVALGSDAGTPAINDPGYELVKAAIKSGYRVCPIPGPSAPLAALAVSGLPSESFLYLGYLPRKSSERKTFLSQVENLPYTLVLLESPHRLMPALKDLAAILGERNLVIARELTKMHEEIWRGIIPEAIEYFTRNEPRGEITLVVAGKQKYDPEKWAKEKLIHEIKSGLKMGENPSGLARNLAEESGWNRREVYRIISTSSK